MPVMGGDELMPILRATYPTLKIIIISGYPEEVAGKDFPSGYVAGFLQKPYTVSVLAEKVAEVLGKHHPTAESAASPGPVNPNET